MSNTPKILRQWIKEEKRIVRLLYRKGLLKTYPKIDELYWESYNRTSKHYKSKHTGKKYSVYLPEIHFCTSDYWGEHDEHSVVSCVLQDLYWANIMDDDNFEPELNGFPKSSFPTMSRKKFIHYLMKLPTVISDNKINKIINNNNEQ